LSTNKAVLVIRVVLEINEFSTQGIVALLALRTSSIRAVCTLSVAILGNELATKFLATLNALEAFGVPSLTYSSEYSVLNGSVALSTVLPFHTFVVIWATLKNKILSSDSTMALSAGHELSSTAGTVYLGMMVIICTNQFLVAFSAGEMLLMICLATSSDIFSTIEGVVALGTM